jgi:PAS domain S-box-containing protein
MELRQTLRKLINSIGTKIIFPYVLLTIIIAGIGAFIVTNLVTGTLQERFDNQLLDSGRVVAEIMVDYEQSRLAVLRAVAGTESVPESVQNRDVDNLEALVPQIVANSDMDAVVLLDDQGVEIFSWFKENNEISAGTDFSQIEEVSLVLNGYVDESGNRRVVLLQTPEEFILFTVGPVFLDGEQVGAVLVGTNTTDMILDLTENAIARVTLYDTLGNIIGTALAAGKDDIDSILQENPQWYKYVATNADSQVPTRSINALNQSYLLAFGDWRLRGQSFGMYSVALPSNFIINAAATSRNSMSLVFSLATVSVFAIGYLISRRIVSPIDQLVQTSVAVTQGNLDHRSGIERGDEIGVLAKSFDNMTHTLELRNQQLMKQASNLNAILQSIADGVIVLDSDNQIVNANLAAKQIIKGVQDDSLPGIEVDFTDQSEDAALRDWLTRFTAGNQKQRYKVGNRVFSALSAPVVAPDGAKSGLVIVMRDITREVEAEERQNNFITNVSHEIRTPLTSVKGFVSLMLAGGEEGLGKQTLQFAEVIDTNTNKLIEHVNRLMEIAEIQSGTLQLNKETISFTQIAEETLQAWEVKAASKDISFVFASTEADLKVLGDASRLAWSIENLLENAFDYTPSGGRVQAQIFKQKGCATLSIIDNGIGINATDQPYIFDRFYRIDNDININTPGMGLGLFIVRFIIRHHGGSIKVDSHPGKGSTFTISLPLAVSH